MPNFMTLTWAAFETALSGQLDPSGAIDALGKPSMENLQATLESIGAGEAGRLLADALTADAVTRPSKLAASLEVIDQHLPVGQARKPTLLRRRRLGEGGQAAPTADSIRSALVASLIDAELGGDPERLRTRIAVAAASWDSAVVANLNGLSKGDRNAEMSAARRVLQLVLRLLLNDLDSRPARPASGRG
jgi:hypothetical protein